MDNLPAIIEARRTLASRYDQDLKDLSFLKPPHIPAGYLSGYQAYVTLYTGGYDVCNLTVQMIDTISAQRDDFMTRLEEEGIATRQGTHAVHTLGYYKKKYGFENSDFINSYAAEKLTVALPLYYGMSDEEYAYVIEKVGKK